MLIDFTAPCWTLTTCEGVLTYLNPAHVAAVCPDRLDGRPILRVVLADGSMGYYEQPTEGALPCSSGYVPGEEDFRIGGTD